MKKQTTFILLLLICFVEILSAQVLIPFRDGDKWGYANRDGKVVIKPKYEEAGEFRASITWVKKNGKYGYIIKEDGEKLDLYLMKQATLDLERQLFEEEMRNIV